MPVSLRCKVKHLCHNGTLNQRERDRLLNGLDAWDKVKAEIKDQYEGCSICEWFNDYDYDENDISEYRSVGDISDIIAIIDKHLQEVKE